MTSVAIRLVGSLLVCAVPAGCSGTPGTEDAPVDASSADAPSDAAPLPTVPLLLWRSETVAPCAEPLTPRFAPPPEPPLPVGSARWVDETRVLGLTALPAILGTGVSLWTTDGYRETPIDYRTGDLGTPFVMDPTLPAPRGPERDTLYRYRGPRMSLGSRTAVSRTPWELLGWTVGDERGAVWAFPELAWLRREEEESLDWYDTADLDHSLPAWSPTTGHVAFAAGLGTNIVAVQCPPPGRPQFLLDFRHLPREPPYRTFVYFRENGELLVFLHRRLWVFSPQGDLLRDVDLGVFAEPLTYDPTCGMLFRTDRRHFEWWDIDTMTARTVLRTTFEPFTGGGTFECGFMVWSGDGATVFRPDMTSFRIGHRDGMVLSLVDGYLISNPETGRAERLNFAGATTSEFATTWNRHQVLTPTGSALSTTTRWELGAEDGGCLFQDCGLNWAHTNSPLPVDP